MTRYARKVVNSAENAWDGKVNDNDLNVFDRPIPLHVHTGDQTDLQSTFAAASFDQCLVWVDHTVIGQTLYFSDGGTWFIYQPKRAIRAVSGATTLLDTDQVIDVDASTAYTITLMTAASYAGRTLVVKITTGANTITLDGSGAETIDGATTFALQGTPESVTLYCTGTAWLII